MQATLENLGALERRLQLAVPVAALESEANARLNGSKTEDITAPATMQ